MDLLEDLRMSLLNFNFVMILVLIKDHLNYLKYNIFEFLFKKHNRLLILFKNNFFHNI